MKLNKPFKDFNPAYHVSQVFHKDHKAIDLIARSPNFGYGMPLCAPEDVRIELIVGDTYTPGDDTNLERGFGVWMRGLDTGLMHQYWHTLSTMPVYEGQLVKRGQIVAFMGNTGYVVSGGQYVPLDKRTVNPYAGTHLHWAAHKNSKRPYHGTKIDPLPLIDMTEPTYTTLDLIRATGVVALKMSKLIT